MTERPSRNLCNASIIFIHFVREFHKRAILIVSLIAIPAILAVVEIRHKPLKLNIFHFNAF